LQHKIRDTIAIAKGNVLPATSTSGERWKLTQVKPK